MGAPSSVVAPTIGVIVVTFQTGRALLDCLNSLMPAPGADEIIVIDNGNSQREEDALDAFAKADARVRVMRGHGNIGFAAACNLAALQTRSDILAFVNPDVVLGKTALTDLATALVAAPPPAIVGGDLRDLDGRADRGGRRERLTLWRAFVSYTGLSRLTPPVPAFRDFNRRDEPTTGPEEVGAISGALMLMRRSDLEALGGFDEGYFLHVEDIDLCRRAQDAGWRVIFQPGPHGVHHRSTSAVDSHVIALHKARSFRRYFCKFAGGPLERMVAEAAGAFLVAVAALTRSR